MATAAISLDTGAKPERPECEWCSLLIGHLNELATLTWYVVADSALVECVMIRALARLKRMPFDASNRTLTYTQAHDTLVREAVAVLKQQQLGAVEQDGLSQGPPALCELPNLPRLAFLLELALRIPQRDVAGLLIPFSQLP
jgi:hypothetical protein